MIARTFRPGRRREWAVAGARASAVVVPYVVGARVGWAEAGAAGSFGAYLMVASFSSLSGRPRAALLGAAAVGLALASVSGALAVQVLPALVAGTAVVAALQGLWEVAGGPLRMAAAMSALAFLLAGVNLGAGLRWWEYAAGFAAGALWQGAVIAVTAPTPDPAVPWALTRDGGPYAATLAVTGVLGVATAWFLPVSHAVWLATTALRVAKPDTATRHGRARARVLGTIAGGALAALLLTPPLTPAARAAVIAVMLFAMQLAGAAHYGWWTLCLTVVALSFGMEYGAGDWRLAGVRMGLTVAGAVLALVVCAIADRRRDRRTR
ncbi:FUSC family protein [Streptomyces sp. NPDC086787]|uniref:FUSC family protein n=1 Tax=Streptomyces sp. NPDC086787 TaxID=3365759 RepID=UPI00382098F0